MATYEITALLRGATPADAAVGREQLEKILQKFEGKVLEKNEWGHKRLWHPIGKVPDAVFTQYRCEIDPQHISNLNREIVLASDILRGYVFRKTKGKASKAKPRTGAPQNALQG